MEYNFNIFTECRDRRTRQRQYSEYCARMRRTARSDLPTEPPEKIFKPKNPELGTLESYEGALSDDYWNKWTRKELTGAAKSWVDSEKLREEARAVGLDVDKPYWLDKECQNLSNGVDIGCLGDGRLPTRGKIAPSAAAEGRRLADTDQVRDRLRTFQRGRVTME